MGALLTDRIFAMFRYALAFALLATPLWADPVREGRAAFLAGDYDMALELLRPEAARGDATALNILGAAYFQGKGVEKDEGLAQDFWEKAAAGGEPKAMYNLGRLLRDKDDPRGAARLFAEAVDLDYMPAYTELGFLLLEDDLAGVNYPLAFDLFQQAAAAGDAVALNNLGAMYENGYGTAPDPSAAMALYHMAAREGEARGAFNLAWFLTTRESAWQDPATGYAWCLRSLSMAHDKDLAEFTLGCDEMQEGLTGAERARARARFEGLMP